MLPPHITIEPRMASNWQPGGEAWRQTTDGENRAWWWWSEMGLDMMGSTGAMGALYRKGLQLQ